MADKWKLEQESQGRGKLNSYRYVVRSMVPLADSYEKLRLELAREYVSLYGTDAAENLIEL
jgi:hypothetical protein